MLIVGAYIIVAIIILVVVWVLWRRKKKGAKSESGTWSMRDQVADLELQQAAMGK